jgi:hypothetical protein
MSIVPWCWLVRRLRKHLEACADLLEVERVLTQLDGSYPDVFRATWTKPPIVLFAGAKDSKNQRLADSAAQYSRRRRPASRAAP